MKTIAKTSLLLVIVLTVAVCIALPFSQANGNGAFAKFTGAGQISGDASSEEGEDERVLATYVFTALNETECAVRISNKSVATEAIIPSVGEIDGKEYKVTEIPNSGFMSSKLIRISLPSTIKKIGSSSFSNCQELKYIDLANVEEISNNVFFRCNELEEITIPSSVNKIGTNIFRNCFKLKRVNIQYLDTLSGGTFFGCTALEEIVISAKIIGNSAFYGCSQLKRVVLINTEEIGSYAFAYCPELTEITLPSTLKAIREYAFLESGIKYE